MKSTVSFSTASTGKNGGFVTGLSVALAVKDEILGTEILTNRTYNIKTSTQVTVGIAYELDLNKFDVNKWVNTDEDGKEQTSYWLTLKGE